MTHDHRTTAHGDVANRFQCAAVTRGCTSTLIWYDRRGSLDERILRANGWRLDHGQWICGEHEAVTP